MLPDTIEPNMDLTDQETLDLTAFILSLKNPEYQEPEQQEPKKLENGEGNEGENP